MNRKNSPGNLTPIIELSLKSGNLHGILLEPHREKTGFLPRRKQRRRSASR